MSLTQDKIKTLKKLTALQKAENISLDAVLDSFESLKNLHLDPQTTTTRSGAPTLSLREDQVYNSSIEPRELLSRSPQKVLAGQISLASIMHGE